MRRIGIRELRQNASRYVALVKVGETIEVTQRGELVALLVAPSPARGAREQLIAAGRLLPAASPTGRLRAPRPVSVDDRQPSNQQLIDAERADRA